MLGMRSNCGTKRSFLLFLYLTCFTICMIPTIVAPPEREFARGQPEMHQAMDNMVSHGVSVKKTGNLPAIDASFYPAALTTKTSNLLDEAEYLLSTLPNSKKKEVERLVQRMRAMAKMLENTAEISKQQLQMEQESVNETPVRENFNTQPTLLDTSAVPILKPVQNPSKTFSKFPGTSSELTKVLKENNIPSKNQASTNLATLSLKKDYEEDDELVQELESLHKGVTANISVQNSDVNLPNFDATSPGTPINLKSFKLQTDDVEEKKARLKEKLLKELLDYQHLGGDIPTGLISALAENNENKSSSYKQKAEVKDTVIDKSIDKNVDEIDNEEHQISDINLEKTELEKDIKPKEDKHLHLKANKTFPHPHLHLQSNFPNFSEFPDYFLQNPLQSKEQPYQMNFENQQKSINFHRNHHTPGSTNHQQSYASNVLMQKMMPLHKSFDGHLMSSNFKDHLLPTHRSHHYPQQLKKEGSADDISTLSSKNHQLNEEMKRQLRDGKIVILSDSVVPLNLETSTQKANSKL